MKMFSILFFLLLTTVLPVRPVDAQGLEIEISARLEQQDVPLNRDVILQVEIRWKGEADQVELLVNPEPEVSNLQLRGSGSANKFIQNQQGETWSLRQITYYYSPGNLGMAYIEPINLTFRSVPDGETGTLTTRRLQVKITDPVQSSEDPHSWQKWILILFLAAGIAVVSVFIQRYRRINKMRKSTQLPIEITAQEKLHLALREITISGQSDYALTLDKIYALFLKVLSELYGLNPEENTRKWLEQLNASGIETPFLHQLKNQVEKIELNRFAGEKTEESQVHLFADSVAYLIEHAK